MEDRDYELVKLAEDGLQEAENKICVGSWDGRELGRRIRDGISEMIKEWALAARAGVQWE